MMVHSSQCAEDRAICARLDAEVDALRKRNPSSRKLDAARARAANARGRLIRHHIGPSADCHTIEERAAAREADSIIHHYKEWTNR